MELAGFIERIDRWGSVAPDRVADVSGDRTLTYRELVTRSDAMAAFLAAGVPDDRSPVVVLGHKEPEMLIAFLGAIKSGHPYVPVDTATPAQRVEKVRLAAGASLVVTPEQVSQATAAPAAAPRGIRPIGPDEPFYIIFTSGSTGEPKGVVITPDCLIGFIEWMIDWHRLPEGGEVILNQASFAFDVSVMDAYLVLLTGNTMFSLRREEIASPQELFAALSASNTTIWSSTPSLVEMCLAERRFAQAMLPRLRRFVLAGEALPPDVALALIERFPRAEVVNAYGPTEATVLASTVTVDRAMIERYDSLPIGVPRPNERMLIVDEERRPLPQGERGEIVITGPNVSPGYLGRPDLNAVAFYEIDGVRAYRTGDWGRIRDGMVFYEGRIDSQIKLHGNRIELGDVEANLRALSGVQDAIVIAQMKGGRPDSLVAFVILSERPDGTDFQLTQRLRRDLAGRVPAYMVPRKFRFVAAFPMTISGKADRKKLAEMPG